MTKKKLTRIIAVCMACLGMGVFAFSGCKKDNGTSNGSGGDQEISSGGKDEDKKDEEGDGKDEDKKDEEAGDKDKNKDEDKDKDKDEGKKEEESKR